MGSGGPRGLQSRRRSVFPVAGGSSPPPSAFLSGILQMNEPKLTTRDDSTWFNLIILLLASVSIMASFNPQWHLWGLDSAKIFPIWIRFVILALLLVFTIPKINRPVGDALSNLLEGLDTTRLSLIYSILAIALVVLFVLYSSKNHFMGDGYAILGCIKVGIKFFPAEPLDYYLHQGIARILGTTERAFYWSYAGWSYLCGISFLIALYYFIEDKAKLILSLAVISCFAVLQFFFGYVENYTFRFIFMFFYSLSAIKDLGKNKISPLTIVLLAFAIPFHLSSAVLVPSAAYLALGKYSDRQRYLYLSIAAIAGLVLGAVYLMIFSHVKLLRIIVPILPTSTNPYTLFLGQHFIDLANWFLLSSPLLLSIFLIKGLREKFFHPFYLLLIGPAIIFTLLVDPILGAYRDWDLMSIAAAPLMAFFIDTLILNKAQESIRTYAIFPTLLLFGLLHTGGWIAQNASSDASYASVKLALRQDIHYSKACSHGDRNKSWAYLVAKYKNDTKEVVWAASERYAGDPDDTLNTYQLAGAYLLDGDTAQAINIISENKVRFNGNISAVSSMSWTMAMAGRYSEAEQMCHSYLSLKGGEPHIFFGLGNIKQLEGQTDSSFYYFDKAYELDSDSTLSKQFKLYLDSFLFGYDKLARSGLERILLKLDPGPKSLAIEILRDLNEPDPVKADSLKTATRTYLKQQGFY